MRLDGKSCHSRTAGSQVTKSLRNRRVSHISRTSGLCFVCRRTDNRNRRGKKINAGASERPLPSRAILEGDEKYYSSKLLLWPDADSRFFSRVHTQIQRISTGEGREPLAQTCKLKNAEVQLNMQVLLNQ